MWGFAHDICNVLDWIVTRLNAEGLRLNQNVLLIGVGMSFDRVS